MRARHGYDVVVIGGGTAGAIAGIASARTGARTLVVDQHGYLGGVLAFGMNIIGAVDGEGYWALGGVGRELVDRLRESGGATAPHASPLFSSVLGQDPEALKIELLKMARDCGLELLFHTTLVDALVEDGVVTGAILANKAGIEMVSAKVFVDATGDADLAAKAGGQYQLGRAGDSLTQPVSRIFSVGGVDITRTIDHMEVHPDDRRPPSGWRQPAPSVAESQPAEAPSVEHLRCTPGNIIEGFGGLLKEAKQAGDLTMHRSHMGVYTFPGRSEVGINLTRSSGVDGTNPDDVTRAEVETQLQMEEAIHFLRKYVPGFEGCYIVSAPGLLGVRESRHVLGHYTLNADDVLGGRSFDDQIGRGAYPLDLHDVQQDATTFGKKVSGAALTIMPVFKSYGIPLRCIIPKGLQNMFVAGRCVSASHEAAGSVRGQAVCMATGHAAGTAAAITSGTTCRVHDLEAESVQSTLLEQNAILDRTERIGSGEPW